MLTGLLLIAAASYRLGVLKFDRKFVIELAPLVVAMVVTVAIAYKQGGSRLSSEGLTTGAKMMVSFGPMLIIMFLLMGEAMVIVNQHKEWLKESMSGNKGLLGSLFAAYTMPGSLTSLPIIRELYDNGSNPWPLFVFMLTSPMVGWQIMLVRQPILGWKLTFIHMALATIVSLCITLVAGVCMRFG